MSNSIVRSALETRLSNWAQAQSVVPAIAFENRNFTKPTASKDAPLWVECKLLPNQPFSRDTTAQNETFIGFFQINIWCPTGIGMGKAEAMANSISQEFPVVPKIGGISIEKPPKVGAPLQDSGWIIVPVLISYRYES